MKLTALLLIPLLAVTLACPSGSTKSLATASDALSHSLKNAETAANDALTAGVISQAERDQFHVLMVKVAQAGLTLDQGIRANESAGNLSGQVNSFLDAFNALNTSGVAGIKDPKTQLAISTILTGAETSIAVIAAQVGK